MITTADDIRAARATLGLSAAGLADALRMGKGGGRSVRRWEAGDGPISGPASVALELMLKLKALEGAQPAAPGGGMLEPQFKSATAGRG